jgi:endogenous inhibitor of DNA gyrase (YacG/DUF329 family)
MEQTMLTEVRTMASRHLPRTVRRCQCGRPIADYKEPGSLCFICEQEAEAAAAKASRRTCPHCGEDFIADPANPAQKYCGVECASHALRPRRPKISRQCPICGTEFPVTSSNPDKRYCSTSCGAIGRHRDKPKRTRACAVCGKEFKPDKEQQRCCSRSCGAIIRRRGGDDLHGSDSKKQ